MKHVSKVLLRAFIVVVFSATLCAPAAIATTSAGSSKHVRKGIIARILDYVFPDISVPPG
jgi:hypothetical protein